MIDVTQFGFAGEYQQIYDMVYRYSREELHPLINRMDEEDWFPEELYRSTHEVGLLGLTVPEEFGGQGLDFLALQFDVAVDRKNRELTKTVVARILHNTHVRSSNGERSERYFVETTITVGEKTRRIELSLISRHQMKYRRRGGGCGCGCDAEFAADDGCRDCGDLAASAVWLGRGRSAHQNPTDNAAFLLGVH